jgi:hypothetical protein
VGNSLTSTNDLPALVEGLAKLNGKNVSTEMIAFPNYSLEDHWNEPNVKRALTKTKFDFVIFQQGPSAMPASRMNLIEYALKFASLCKENNTTLCMYMVWPSRDRSFDLDNVIKSYAIASDTTGGITLSVGIAWKRILDEKKDFPLYSSDGFHPTIHGTFLSAMVIYGKLFNKKDFDFVTMDNLPSALIKQPELDLMKRTVIEATKN